MNKKVKVLFSALLAVGGIVPIALASYKTVSTNEAATTLSVASKAMRVEQDQGGNWCPVIPQATQDYYNSHPEEKLPPGWYMCGTPIWYNPRKPEPQKVEPTQVQEKTIDRAEYVSSSKSYFSKLKLKYSETTAGFIWDHMADLELLARENFDITPGPSEDYVKVRLSSKYSKIGSEPGSYSILKKNLLAVETITPYSSLLKATEKVRGKAYVENYIKASATESTSKSYSLKVPSETATSDSGYSFSKKNFLCGWIGATGGVEIGLISLLATPILGVIFGFAFGLFAGYTCGTIYDNPESWWDSFTRNIRDPFYNFPPGVI